MKVVYHKAYVVQKLRFGHESWEHWVYGAVSTTANYEKAESAKRGITERHKTLDALARELATFPGVNHAEFFSDISYKKDATRRVSLMPGPILTQNGEINDEELGELALLILKYLPKKK